VGNQENEYPVPDPTKQQNNVNNEFSDIHKKCLKEEIMDEITEEIMEKL
jgi:hypothetical protein